MKSQKELCQRINKWQTAISLETGKKIAIQRCDNARKYQKLENRAHVDRIQMKFTTAYTQEKNGVVERFNRTIIQMSKVILTWSKLPQIFWVETANKANYLQSLLPKIQDDLSPKKPYDGNKPNSSQI